MFLFLFINSRNEALKFDNLDPARIIWFGLIFNFGKFRKIFKPVKVGQSNFPSRTEHAKKISFSVKMQSIRLATGGDVVAIWEGVGYNPVHTFSPTSGTRKVISTSWNNDGSCLASCVESSDKILLTSIKPASFTTVEVETSLGVSPIRVLYPRTSIKLVIVGSTDKVR